MQYYYLRPEKLPETQKNFNNRYELQIKCAQYVQKVAKDVLPVLKDFDGKVINKRLTDAINFALNKYVVKKHGYTYHYTVRFKQDDYGDRKLCICFPTYLISDNYGSDEFYIVIPDINDRLDMDSEWQQQQIEKFETGLKAYIQERKTIMKQFASAYKRAMAIEKIIGKYNEETHWLIRYAADMIQFQIKYNTNY